MPHEEVKHEALKKRLPYRAKQLKFALFTRYKKEHIEFARKYLSINELALFDRLPSFEKKHAVQTAKHMLHLTHGNPKVDERKMVKLALLHDIGKAATKLSVLDKVILVIFNRYFKGIYGRLAAIGIKDNSRSIFRKFYVHKYHDEIGAEMLRRAGLEPEIVEAVEKHSLEPSPTEPEELKLLRTADTIY